MNNHETVKLLNDLLTKAYDAEQGYANAAERVTPGSHLCRFFYGLSRQRESFVEEIKSLMAHYDGKPHEGASLLSKVHCIWFLLKDLVTGDETEILEECIRGEAAAIREYDAVLTLDDLPHNVRTLVSRQRNIIASCIHEIHNEEDAVSEIRSNKLESAQQSPSQNTAV
ncbi:MAG: PA2169 family four-helix-bundle protein [Verrucomicrobiales bacterium]|nr:PA2169 family four-helix-bundle protein [Verrucomicrobiales bacterium]